MNLLRRGVCLLIKTHVPVALSACLLAMVTGSFAGNHNFFSPVYFFVFCVTLAAYNVPFASLVPIGQGIRVWFDRGPGTALFALSAMAGAWTFLLMPRLPIPVVAAGMLLAAGYQMPFRAGNRRVPGLRNIPFAKNVILASVWALATAWFPLVASAHAVTRHDLFFLIAERFCFILALCIVFDMRDIDKDMRHRIKTVPVLFGIRTARHCAIGLLILFILLVWIHGMSLQATARLAFIFPLTLSAFITGLLALVADHTMQKGRYSLLMDSTMIVQFVLVALCWPIGR